MLQVILHPGRDRSIRRRHPWLLSGAIARVDAPAGEDAAGAWARVLSHEGELLGHGHYSPTSNIRVRLLGFGKDGCASDAADADARIATALGAAVARRDADVARALFGATEALRLINAEGDGLPGLIVDRYADVLVVKFSSIGMQRRRAALLAALRQATGAAAAVERVDGREARREGYAARDGVLWGQVPESVEIHERDRRYRVDVLRGQKTGFYLDQREARDRVEALAQGRRVLDLFCYTGGFAAAAARGGASGVTLVDSSGDALALARTHVEDNAGGTPIECQQEDAFRFVRAARAGRSSGASGQFDLLVIDPPPLARRKADVPRATRAYKDVLLHALGCASPGALLLAFSCSHHVGPDLFRKVVFGASVDAGRAARVLAELGAPADHPVSLDHPEGRYLSGLLLEV